MEEGTATADDCSGAAAIGMAAAVAVGVVGSTVAEGEDSSVLRTASAAVAAKVRDLVVDSWQDIADVVVVVDVVVGVFVPSSLAAGLDDEWVRLAPSELELDGPRRVDAAAGDCRGACEQRDVCALPRIAEGNFSLKGKCA